MRVARFWRSEPGEVSRGLGESDPLEFREQGKRKLQIYSFIYLFWLFPDLGKDRRWWLLHSLGAGVCAW